MLKDFYAMSSSTGCTSDVPEEFFSVELSRTFPFFNNRKLPSKSLILL